jgi:methylthioribulose-1-phosphate dehydratase
MTFEPEKAQKALAAQGRDFYSRGWMLGTSGNLSIRVSAEGPIRMAITASGVDKGLLEPKNILLHSVDSENSYPDGQKPSAETVIHEAVYQSVANAQSVLHVHTVESTVVSLQAAETSGMSWVEFQGFEMIKGLGLWTSNAIAKVPVFENHGDVSLIADELRAYLDTAPNPLPLFLIRGHGLTAWGASLGEARRHLEIGHFLCACRVLHPS